MAALGRSETPLRTLCRELTARGAAAEPIICDVSVRTDVDLAVAQAEQRLGPIDVLINNAGVAESAPFVTMEDELWDRMLSINLTGTYRCMRAVVPGMFERRRGRIINIASIAAKVGFPYTAAYVASKHGVLGLTRAVATEAFARGVTVNAICPGWLDTGMTDRSVARITEKTGQSPEEARRALERMNPQQRFVHPDEVASIAAFLASAEADGINGREIDI